MNDPKYVTPSEKATPRTLNRLREYGPVFYLGREMPDVVLTEGGVLKFVKARLLCSRKGYWVGWVPADHIRIDTLAKGRGK